MFFFFIVTSKELASFLLSEEEEEKGPGFSRPHTHLITVGFHWLLIPLIYFHMFVTPILILRVTLSIDLPYEHMACKETHSIVLIEH